MGKKIDRVRIIVWSLLVTIAVSMIWGYMAGWRQTRERSMEPTLSVVSLVKIAFGVLPEEGQIGIFITPGRTDRSVKRVQHRTPDGWYYWMRADNGDWAGEDSDDYGWVRKDRLVGTVVAVQSPRRALRSLSRKGQFQNWLEFCFSPTDQREAIPGFITWYGRLAEYFWDSCESPAAKKLVIQSNDWTLTFNVKEENFNVSGEPNGLHLILLIRDEECKVFTDNP